MTQLIQIVSTSQHVAETRSRLRKIAHLAHCLKSLMPDEIDIGVAYLAGELPQGRLGIGPAGLRDTMPTNPASIPSLSLHQVNEALTEIGLTTGSGSNAKRRHLLANLFARATLNEQVYLSRLLLGEVRQGALEGLLVEAIAQAAQVPSTEVRRALMITSNLPKVTQAAFGQGIMGLRRFKIRLLEPLKPMLAQPTENISTALNQLGAAGLEYKLDGARIQVHKLGQDVRVFTRQLNEVSKSIPEVVDTISAFPCTDLILDGEALALQQDGKPLPFQVTMRRFGRKLNVEHLRQKLPLKGFYFDCLYLNGQELLDAPGEDRFRALREAVPAEFLIPRRVTDDPAEAETFLNQALSHGHEGLMAKSLSAPYAAGNRGNSWLKIKHVYTLDLVILAAEWGSGRRQGWLSNLHLGARDPVNNSYIMLGKTFKGLTDKLLTWQTEKLLNLEFARDDHIVYVRPELVVEIAFNEIQASPHYPGGLALRFARVKRYRQDKHAEDADTIDSVREIYQRQHVIDST